MGKKVSTCCTCGYSWKTGRDGSHSCAVELEKSLKNLKAEIVSLAIDGLTTDGAHHKQWFLNEILSKLIVDNQEWGGLKETYGWDEGRIP
jgi:hypothetical protein